MTQKYDDVFKNLVVIKGNCSERHSSSILMEYGLYKLKAFTFRIFKWTKEIIWPTQLPAMQVSGNIKNIFFLDDLNYVQLAEEHFSSIYFSNLVSDSRTHDQ